MIELEKWKNVACLKWIVTPSEILLMYASDINVLIVYCMLKLENKNRIYIYLLYYICLSLDYI